MTRLPQPGGDYGDWGQILNDFLLQSHNTDGSIKDGVVVEDMLAPSVGAKLDNVGTVADGSVTETKLAPDVVTKLNAPGTIADGSVTETKLAPDVVTKLNSTGTGGVSAINGKTGDVTLAAADVGALASTYTPSWDTLTNKPAVIAAGVDAASARAAIGAGDGTVTVANITDASVLGRAIAQSSDPATARAQLGIGADQVGGNAYIIHGATAARVNPVDGSSIPAGASVFWISSTQPTNMDSTLDVWLNI